MLKLNNTRNGPVSMQVVGHKWSDTNGSVLVRVCLLRCEEEVCFKILKWFNIKNKIRLLDFLSPPNDCPLNVPDRGKYYPKGKMSAK